MLTWICKLDDGIVLIVYALYKRCTPYVHFGELCSDSFESLFFEKWFSIWEASCTISLFSFFFFLFFSLFLRKDKKKILFRCDSFSGLSLKNGWIFSGYCGFKMLFVPYLPTYLFVFLGLRKLNVVLKLLHALVIHSFRPHYWVWHSKNRDSKKKNLKMKKKNQKKKTPFYNLLYN